MRIKKRFGTDIIIITILLSTLSSLYIWTPVLKQLKIHHANKQKTNSLMMKYGKISKIVVGFIGLYLAVVGIKVKLIPYMKQRKLKDAEQYAETLYRSEFKSEFK